MPESVVIAIETSSRVGSEILEHFGPKGPSRA